MEIIFRRFLLLLSLLLSSNVHKIKAKKTLKTQSLQNLLIKVTYCKFTVFLTSDKKDSFIGTLPKIQNAYSVSILNFE